MRDYVVLSPVFIFFCAPCALKEFNYSGCIEDEGRPLVSGFAESADKLP